MLTNPAPPPAPPPPPPPPRRRGQLPAPPPPGAEQNAPVVKQHKDPKDETALNYFFEKMSPTQVQSISPEHVPYLRTDKLTSEDKVQSLTLEQFKQWIRYNREDIKHIVRSMSPIQCTCLPKEAMDWELIEQMTTDQVLLLSPEQTSLTKLPDARTLHDVPMQHKHSIILQKQAVRSLSTKLKRIETEAQTAQAAKKEEILAGYDRSPFGNEAKKFKVWKTTINVGNGVFASNETEEKSFTWNEVANHRSKQYHGNNINTLLETIPALSRLFPESTKERFLSLIKNRALLQNIKNVNLDNHIIIGITEQENHVEIDSIKFADAPALARPLKAYLLKELSDEDKQEINAAQENARAEQMAELMNGVDQNIRNFIENLNWNSDIPLAPELRQLVLNMTDSGNENRINALKNEQAAQLNELYLKYGYLLLHNGSLASIPSLDIRSLRELSGEGDFLHGAPVYISDKNKTLDQECISIDKTSIIETQSVKVDSVDGLTHISIGQNKVPFKNFYHATKNARITTPSLSVLFKVADNIYEKLIERFYSDVQNPKETLKLNLDRYLHPHLGKHGIYWIKMSKCQRAAIEHLSEYAKALFEPYLLPDNIKT